MNFSAVPAHQSNQTAPVLGSAVRALADQVSTTMQTKPDKSEDVLAQLSSIFEVLDLDGNGDLDFAEFKVGLNSIGIQLTHDEAITLFESIDTENEGYINKDGFLEWLQKDHSDEAQIDVIREKLQSALNQAQEVNNPLQDLEDDAEIDALLGDNDEYLKELQNIKRAKTVLVHEDADDDDADRDGNASDGTTKINDYSDGEQQQQHDDGNENGGDANHNHNGHEDEDEQEHEEEKQSMLVRPHQPSNTASGNEMDEDSDSLTSVERAEIARAKASLSRRNSLNSTEKKKKKKNSQDFDIQIEQIDGAAGNSLESSLMEQEMNKMKQQEMFKLERMTSGRGAFREEQADQWDNAEMDAEINEMRQQRHHLAQQSLTMSQAMMEANAVMDEFRKSSLAEPTTPLGNVDENELAGTTARELDAVLDGAMAVDDDDRKKLGLTGSKYSEETVDLPSQIDVQYDTTLDHRTPSIIDKHMPPKRNSDTSASADRAAIAATPATAKDALRVQTSMSPNPAAVQEIKNTGTPHTTSSQPVMVGDGGGDDVNDPLRPTSYSYSSQPPPQPYMNGHGGSGMTDISHFTSTQPMTMMQPMQQQLISAPNGGGGGVPDEFGFHNHHQHQQHRQSHGNTNELLDSSPHNLVVRALMWYISPMHEKHTLHRLWYHGANTVLSIAMCAVMLTLFVCALLLIPFCGLGLIFIYWQCLLSRHFAVIDSSFANYFFGSNVFPRFSIFIPKSHEQSAIGALKEYITDAHMLEVIVYFTFVKLPACFILSGISMVIFSGVVAVLLTPLVYWLDPNYFLEGRFCLFGTPEELTHVDGTSNVVCSGWAINSFGETFIAFCCFIPALPLALHLSNFTAKLLCRVTFNFLSISSGTPTTTPMNNGVPDMSHHTPYNTPYNMNTFETKRSISGNGAI